MEKCIDAALLAVIKRCASHRSSDSKVMSRQCMKDASAKDWLQGCCNHGCSMQVALKLIHEFDIDKNGQRPSEWLKGGSKYTLQAATLGEWSVYEKLGATKGISKRPHQGVPYVLEHGKSPVIEDW